MLAPVPRCTGGEQIIGTGSGGCGHDTFTSSGHHGHVITDNQGIVKQLLVRRRMCRSGSREGTSLALPAWDNSPRRAHIAPLASWSPGERPSSMVPNNQIPGHGDNAVTT